MTISKDTSAPLIVVVGATGAQGGSVVLNLAESDKPYRIRGFTRDTSSSASQDLTKQGVEMVVLEPKAENREKVLEAFKGATYAFVVTIAAMMTSKQVETEEGKLFVDAAKAANVKLLLWSGLPNVTELTGGKYTHVENFDSKAAVTDYAKSVGIPFVNVQAGGYMENYTAFIKPVKQADGSFVIFLPPSPDALQPLIDCRRDYGLFVRRAIEEPSKAGTEVHAHTQMISFTDLVKTWSEGTGKKITYVQLTKEQHMEAMTSRGMPASAVQGMYEMLMYMSDFGYWGKADGASSREGLARKLRTWAEFVKETDWSNVLV